MAFNTDTPQVQRFCNLLDALQGGTRARDILASITDAKQKLNDAGFSDEAQSAMVHFAKNVGDLIEMGAQAHVTLLKLHDTDAGDFALAVCKYMTSGLAKTHAMLDKAGVKPDVFGLNDKMDDSAINNVVTNTKMLLRATRRFTITDKDGNTKDVPGATEVEAACNVLADMGYTLNARRV